MLTLSEDSFDWALKHALNYGDTDVFPVPFEYKAIEHDWIAVRAHLCSSNVMSWNTRPARTLIAPKAKLGFRTITQLDPLDFLVLGALVHDIAPELESRRIPVADDVVFSYRVSTDTDGQLFDPDVGYRQFLDKSREKVASGAGVAFVGVTDISDFYSRIYHHRLENALRAVTDKTSHVSSIMNLLSGWNGTETFGIPVGGAASRILAEIALSDVDEALLANGVDFIRFNDDYRIFGLTEVEVYQHLSFLAQTLHSNHGLTLQQQKTSIHNVMEFEREFLSTPLDREMDSLHEKFYELIEELGLVSGYEEIDYDDLTEDQQELVDSLNLGELFREEVSKSEPDLPVVKFCLRRLGQLGDDSIVDEVFDVLELLIPAFVDVVQYIERLRYLGEQERSVLGGKLLDLLDDSMVSELVYHRMWILQIFTESNEWDNEGRFVALFNEESEQACKRKLILAMGQSGQRHWFQSQWRALFDHPHWQRRALLAAASCMPRDARKHWYRSLDAQLDVLERATAKWAKANPFNE